MENVINNVTSFMIMGLFYIIFGFEPVALGLLLLILKK
jgi:hypothetical protein|tara:strand:- start:19 stop:132 length:114 start_codon:yes stop_codon:yes gene_type:complete